jgi:hypothetical protein
MKQFLLLLSIVFLFIMGCNNKPARETEYGSYLYNHKAMPMDTANSLQYKWDHKKILADTLIDGMESLENWELTYGNKSNVATFSLSGE